MRKLLFAVCMFVGSIAPAGAQLAVSFAAPGVSIGINVPTYPSLVPIPGYPVYYAPRLGANYFFYDGMYWVFEGDNWYASSWYNGPWALVEPEFVPVYILRVPVRYYYRRPPYFYGWRVDAAPRWGEHWGATWAQHRAGWDRWNRASAPRPAPLPVYQRQYSGNRYPQAEQQYVLHSRNYRYEPRDAVVRQTFAAQRTQESRMAGPKAPERKTHPSAAQPRPPQAQRAPTPTPSRASAAPPNATQQTQRAPNAAKAPPRPSPDERISARQAPRGGPPPAVAQDRTSQRAQPPQKEGGNPPRDVDANAPRSSVIAQQAQRPQPQHSEAPRGPEPRKGQERGRDKDERQGAEHNK